MATVPTAALAAQPGTWRACHVAGSSLRDWGEEEVVLYDGHSGRIHLLSAIAGQIWQELSESTDGLSEGALLGALGLQNPEPAEREALISKLQGLAEAGLAECRDP